MPSGATAFVKFGYTCRVTSWLVIQVSRTTPMANCHFTSAPLRLSVNLVIECNTIIPKHHVQSMQMAAEAEDGM